MHSILHFHVVARGPVAWVTTIQINSIVAICQIKITVGWVINF